MDLKQGLFTNFANFDDTIISKKNYQILIDRVRILINGGGGEMECAWSAN